MKINEVDALVKTMREYTMLLADIIKLEGSIPSGHLYARMMGACRIEDFNMMIDCLKDVGLIKYHSNHLIEWIGG